MGNHFPNRSTIIDYVSFNYAKNLPTFSFIGAGYALSDASKRSGLSAWMGLQLTGLEVLPRFAIMAIVSSSYF